MLDVAFTLMVIATLPEAFLNKLSLQEAVNSWIMNRTRAEVTYGHISTWDVSRVSDMSFLFCGLSQTIGCCSAAQTFNDDIGQWNTSSVTNMRVRCTSCHTLGCARYRPDYLPLPRHRACSIMLTPSTARWAAGTRHE